VSVAYCWAPSADAVSVTGVDTDTSDVLTVTCTLVAPAAIGTLACICAEPFELVSATRIPPAGAGAVRSIVAVELWVPITDVGLTVMSLSATAADCTVRLAVAESTPAVAVITVGVSVVTDVALTVVDSVVVPAEIVTEVGAKLRMPFGLAVRFTVRSDAIGLARVTVPVTVLLLLPPTMVEALSDRLKLSGSTVTVSVAGLPTEGVAVIVSVMAAATTFVAILIDSLVLFVVNGTGVWGAADGSELLRVTM